MANLIYKARAEKINIIKLEMQSKIKLDELPLKVIVHILTYLNRREHLGMQTLSTRFYAAVADVQLLEKVQYYTEGFKETEALYRKFKYFDKYQFWRYQFVFGLLYLAYSRKYKLKFHND